MSTRRRFASGPRATRTPSTAASPSRRPPVTTSPHPSISMLPAAQGGVHGGAWLPTYADEAPPGSGRRVRATRRAWDVVVGMPSSGESDHLVDLRVLAVTMMMGTRGPDAATLTRCRTSRAADVEQDEVRPVALERLHGDLSVVGHRDARTLLCGARASLNDCSSSTTRTDHAPLSLRRQPMTRVFPQRGVRRRQREGAASRARSTPRPRHRGSPRRFTIERPRPVPRSRASGPGPRW